MTTSTHTVLITGASAGIGAAVDGFTRRNHSDRGIHGFSYLRIRLGHRVRRGGQPTGCWLRRIILLIELYESFGAIRHE